MTDDDASTKANDAVSAVSEELPENRNARDEKGSSAKRTRGFDIWRSGEANGKYVHKPDDTFNGKPVFHKYWGYSPGFMYFNKDGRWMVTNERESFSRATGFLLSEQKGCASPHEVKDWKTWDEKEKKWKVNENVTFSELEHQTFCGMCDTDIKGRLFKLRPEHVSCLGPCPAFNTLSLSICEVCWTTKLEREKKELYDKVEVPLKNLPVAGFTDPTHIAAAEKENEDESFKFFACFPEEWELCPYTLPCDNLLFCPCACFECTIRFVVYHIVSAMFVPFCFLLRASCNAMGCTCEDEDTNNDGDNDDGDDKVGDDDDKDDDQTKVPV